MHLKLHIPLTIQDLISHILNKILKSLPGGDSPKHYWSFIWPIFSRLLSEVDAMQHCESSISLPKIAQILHLSFILTIIYSYHAFLFSTTFPSLILKSIFSTKHIMN
jgi:hypothetical protein